MPSSYVKVHVVFEKSTGKRYLSFNSTKQDKKFVDKFVEYDKKKSKPLFVDGECVFNTFLTDSVVSKIKSILTSDEKLWNIKLAEIDISELNVPTDAMYNIERRE